MYIIALKFEYFASYIHVSITEFFLRRLLWCKNNNNLPALLNNFSRNPMLVKSSLYKFQSTELLAGVIKRNRNIF